MFFPAVLIMQNTPSKGCVSSGNPCLCLTACGGTENDGETRCGSDFEEYPVYGER